MEKLSKVKESKIARKQKRCQAIILKDTGIASSETPTKFLAICNAGLSTGLQEEILLNEVLKHGTIEKVVMVPNKSYCFLCCGDIHSSEKIYKTMHASSELGQNNGVLYFSYVVKIPTVENPWGRTLPPGLILIEDFVSEEEEKQILNAVKDSAAGVTEGSLKHRKVKHFGYEFLYGSNQVDPNVPLNEEIPNICTILWPRLEQQLPTLDWYKPDQLTVNQYAPGQGIPPHVDTHSAFLDPILSLSLEGGTVMEFKRQQEHVRIHLPRRSLLVLSGESRYDWTHGIVPRHIDYLPSASGGLTARNRDYRTSLTFRKLRRGSCDCKFPTHCDTKKEYLSEKTKPTLNCVAEKLELENVHKVYNEIASHFSETRHSPWPKVAEFLNSFQKGSILLDIGCGNGKYLKVNENIIKMGCDRSEGLLKICSSQKYNIFKCDCLAVPFRDSSINGCFSIAVIHHLASEERRLKAIKEMARILVKGGRALIYVWSKNQQADAKKSSYLRQNKALNKNKINEEELRSTQQIGHAPSAEIDLPIHTNRTQFQDQDVLVPWKLKNKNQERNEGPMFLRFYHVFEEGELIELCKKVKEIEINCCYYDQGNWCVIFTKL